MCCQPAFVNKETQDSELLYLFHDPQVNLHAGNDSNEICRHGRPEMKFLYHRHRPKVASIINHQSLRHSSGMPACSVKNRVDPPILFNASSPCVPQECMFSKRKMARSFYIGLFSKRKEVNMTKISNLGLIEFHENHIYPFLRQRNVPVSFLFFNLDIIAM